MLLTKLFELQQALGMSDVQFAKTIRMPRTTYNGLRNRRTRLSLEQARRIIEAYPGLAKYAFEPEPLEEQAG